MTDYKAEPIGELRYKALLPKKQFYLDGAKDCCRYTIPSLLSFFEERGRTWADIRTPYQGIGARGLSNLASKLLSAITPANVPMFRLIIDDDTLKEERQAEDEMWSTDVESSLTAYSEAVLNCIKASGDYAHMYEVWQLLLVSGNVLIFDPDNNGNIRVYSLRDYVIKRDRSGNVTEVVLRESVSPKVLSEEVLNQLESESELSEGSENYDLYTYAIRKGDFYYTHQECRGVVLKDSEGKYPLEGCPFIPIRMYTGAGEDYSRSYVSNYLGDLKSADGLCQGTVEGAAMAAKHIYLVRPDGLTDIKDVEDTPNGGVVYGRADDIGVMQSNKGYDLRIVSEEASKIERRLSQAFLLLDGGIRSAERVTREEIKLVATELESALGGVYSVMCHSFQVPYIKRKIFKLQRLGKIGNLDDKIKPVVVTGFEALGMNGDRDRLLEFMGIMSQTLGNGAMQYINPQVFIKQLATSMSMDISGLIKGDEVLQQEQAATEQQVMGSQLMDKALPAALGNAEGLQKVINNMM